MVQFSVFKLILRIVELIKHSVLLDSLEKSSYGPENQFLHKMGVFYQSFNGMKEVSVLVLEYFQSNFIFSQSAGPSTSSPMLMGEKGCQWTSNCPQF